MSPPLTKRPIRSYQQVLDFLNAGRSPTRGRKIEAQVRFRLVPGSLAHAQHIEMVRYRDDVMARLYPNDVAEIYCWEIGGTSHALWRYFRLYRYTYRYTRVVSGINCEKFDATHPVRTMLGTGTICSGTRPTYPSTSINPVKGWTTHIKKFSRVFKVMAQVIPPPDPELPEYIGCETIKDAQFFEAIEALDAAAVLDLLQRQAGRRRFAVKTYSQQLSEAEGRVQAWRSAYRYRAEGLHRIAKERGYE